MAHPTDPLARWSCYRCGIMAAQKPYTICPRCRAEVAAQAKARHPSIPTGHPDPALIIFREAPAPPMSHDELAKLSRDADKLINDR